MQISVVRPSELGPSEIATWHSMQSETASLANPFLCPEFSIAVGSFRSAARVAILVDGSTIVGFFPFELRRLGIGVPIGFGLTDCQGVIHSPDVEWNAQELLNACNISAWQFDHLVDGQKPFERYATVGTPSSAIDLSDGFAVYHDKLRVKSAKFCRQIASKARILDRDAGSVRFAVDSRELSGLRALMSWKSDQFRRTGWIDLFDRRWIVDLVDYIFTTRNDRFGGQLSLMYAGDALVSAQLDIRFDHVLAGWFAAYNMHFHGQSPGMIHHLRKAKEAAAIGVKLIDLGKGTETYKEKLKNYELVVWEGMVDRGSMIGAAQRVRMGAVRRAGPWIRRHPYIFQAANHLLRHYGRIS